MKAKRLRKNPTFLALFWHMELMEEQLTKAWSMWKSKGRSTRANEDYFIQFYCKYQLVGNQTRISRIQVATSYQYTCPLQHHKLFEWMRANLPTKGEIFRPTHREERRPKIRSRPGEKEEEKREEGRRKGKQGQDA